MHQSLTKQFVYFCTDQIGLYHKSNKYLFYNLCWKSSFYINKNATIFQSTICLILRSSWAGKYELQRHLLIFSNEATILFCLFFGTQCLANSENTVVSFTNANYWLIWGKHPSKWWWTWFKGALTELDNASKFDQTICRLMNWSTRIVSQVKQALFFIIYVENHCLI